MKLPLFLAVAFRGSVQSFQILPDTNVGMVSAPPVPFGYADDLIQEAEQEWESTLENKLPRSRKFYDEQAELEESMERAAKSPVEKITTKPMWCDDADSWMSPIKKGQPF